LFLIRRRSLPKPLALLFAAPVLSETNICRPTTPAARTLPETPVHCTAAPSFIACRRNAHFLSGAAVRRPTTPAARTPSETPVHCTATPIFSPEPPSAARQRPSSL